MKRIKGYPRVVAVHKDNKVSYHYVESAKEALELEGRLLAEFETGFFLRHEGEIHKELKQKLEKTNEKN